MQRLGTENSHICASAYTLQRNAIQMFWFISNYSCLHFALLFFLAFLIVSPISVFFSQRLDRHFHIQIHMWTFLISHVDRTTVNSTTELVDIKSNLINIVNFRCFQMKLICIFPKLKSRLPCCPCLPLVTYTWIVRTFLRALNKLILNYCFICAFLSFFIVRVVSPN